MYTGYMWKPTNSKGEIQNIMYTWFHPAIKNKVVLQILNGLGLISKGIIEKDGRQPDLYVKRLTPL